MAAADAPSSSPVAALDHLARLGPSQGSEWSCGCGQGVRPACGFGMVVSVNGCAARKEETLEDETENLAVGKRKDELEKHHFSLIPNTRLSHDAGSQTRQRCCCCHLNLTCVRPCSQAAASPFVELP